MRNLLLLLFLFPVSLLTSNLYAMDKVNDSVWQSTMMHASAKVNKKLTLMNVAYGNNKFVAVGQRGSTFISKNGKDWAYQKITNETLMGIAYGNGVFVVIGNYGTILRSTDNGIHWSKVKSGVKNYLISIVYAKGKFVAVGGNGLILTSKNGENWRRASQITQQDLSGVNYGDEKFIIVGIGNEILTSKDAMKWQISGHLLK